MITFSSRGSFKRTDSFLKSMSRFNIRSQLESYGQRGVAALSAATPVDSGLASGSWGYKVTSSGKNWTITWTNSDNENGFPVAVMLQHGHGTGTGGWVAGRDYINPAMRPIFDEIVNSIWKVVTSA